MGSRRYRNARELLITADGGGNNGSRSRLGKVSLQNLAIRLGIPVRVCHLPPGTSKWNKIGHRMFCHITQNWRGRPLVSHEVIIQLIANTTAQAGFENPRRTGPEALSHRNTGQRRRTGLTESETIRLSRGMELHPHAVSKINTTVYYDAKP